MFMRVNAKCAHQVPHHPSLGEGPAAHPGPSPGEVQRLSDRRATGRAWRLGDA
jgi:hypothetical protein